MMWYYMINGVQNGPVSEQDIIANIKAGVITRSTLVRAENDNIWDRITQSPNFSSFFHVESNDVPHHKQPQTFGQQKTTYQFDNNPQRNNYVNTTPYQQNFQVSSPQIGTPQMASPQMGTPQIGMSQMGTPQMGAPQMGMPQMGTPQMGTPQLGAPYNVTGTQYNFSSNNVVNSVNFVSPVAPTASHPLAERTEPLLPPTPAEAYRASESADSQMNSDVNGVGSPYSDSMRETNAVKESSETMVSSETTENKLSLPAFEQAGNHRRNGKHSSPKTKGRKSTASSKKSAIDSIRNFAKEYPYAFYGISSILLFAVIVIGFASFRRSHSSVDGKNGVASAPINSSSKINRTVETLPPGKIRVVLDDVRTMGERPETYIEKYGWTSLTTRNFWGFVYSSKPKDTNVVYALDGIIAMANENGMVYTSVLTFKWVKSSYGGKRIGRPEAFKLFQNGEWMLCNSKIRFPRICCQRKDFNTFHNCEMVGVNTSNVNCPYLPHVAYLMNKDHSFSKITNEKVVRKLYNEGYAIFVPEGDLTTLVLSLKMDPLVMQDIQKHGKYYYVDIYIQNVHYKDWDDTTLYNYRKLVANYGDCSAFLSDDGAYTQIDIPREGYVGVIAAVQVRNKFSDKIVAAAYSDGRKLKTEVVDVKDVIREDLWLKNQSNNNEDMNDEESDESDAEDE